MQEGPSPSNVFKQIKRFSGIAKSTEKFRSSIHENPEDAEDSETEERKLPILQSSESKISVFRA